MHQGPLGKEICAYACGWKRGVEQERYSLRPVARRRSQNGQREKNTREKQQVTSHKLMHLIFLRDNNYDEVLK